MRMALVFAVCGMLAFMFAREQAARGTDVLFSENGRMAEMAVV